jgi:hypothetical protein
MIAGALALLAVGPSYAQKLDKNGRCHDAAGKFAKAEVCKGAAGGTTDNKNTYKLDAKGNCHDAKGRMAKKSVCTVAG